MVSGVLPVPCSGPPAYFPGGPAGETLGGKTMVQRAHELVEEARRGIAPVEARIRQHPYLQALEGRRVARSALAIFAGQQRHIIESDLRSVALIVARSASQKARDFFLGMLQGERAAMEALAAFGKAVGISGGDPVGEPLPGAFAYSARMSRALRDGYGLSAEEVAFFDLFASAPPGFEEQGLAVVEEGLAGGVEPARIRRAARLLQGFELLYWDTMLQATQG